MLHELIKVWFHWVEIWGYFGIFLLMAMESSIIPVPSEIVLPPAAFWAAQGRFSFSGVIIAATAGSYFGSILSYGVSRGLGQPLIQKYGNTVGLSQDKIKLAEDWILKFGVFGIFTARLLPVVRHLVSIPAGVLAMSVVPFSLATILGAGLWCTILSWFGQEVIGSNPELLQSPEMMMGVVKAKLHWFLGAVLLLAVLYAAVYRLKKRLNHSPHAV